MKQKFAFACICALSLATLGTAQAANTPTQAVNAFYQSIIEPAGTGVPGSHVDRTQLSKDLSLQLQRVEELPPEYGLDFDPWGGAQVGIDKFAVVQGLTTGNKSQIEVNVHRCRCDFAKVNVFLIKEDGDWKIDNIVVPKDSVDLRSVLNSLIENYNQKEAKH